MTADTPRTDAAEFRHCPPQPEAMLKKHEDAYALSRELEQELAASKAEVERLRGQLTRGIEVALMIWGDRPCDKPLPELRAELDALKATLTPTDK